MASVQYLLRGQDQRYSILRVLVEELVVLSESFVDDLRAHIFLDLIVFVANIEIKGRRHAGYLPSILLYEPRWDNDNISLLPCCLRGSSSI